MKTLDLNAYGVMEMNEAEMQSANGGFLQLLAGLVVGVIVAELLDRNAARDFMDGWNAAKPK